MRGFVRFTHLKKFKGGKQFSCFLLPPEYLEPLQCGWKEGLLVGFTGHLDNGSGQSTADKLRITLNRSKRCTLHDIAIKKKVCFHKLNVFRKYNITLLVFFLRIFDLRYGLYYRPNHRKRRPSTIAMFQYIYQLLGKFLVIIRFTVLHRREKLRNFLAKVGNDFL